MCGRQVPPCHAERMSRSPEPFASLKGKLREGEASDSPASQTLRCAQGDTGWQLKFTLMGSPLLGRLARWAKDLFYG